MACKGESYAHSLLELTLMAKIINFNADDVSRILKFGRVNKLLLGCTHEVCQFLLRLDPMMSNEGTLKLWKTLLNSKTILRKEQKVFDPSLEE